MKILVNTEIRSNDRSILAKYDKVYRSSYLDPISGSGFFKLIDYTGFLQLISILKSNKDDELLIEFNGMDWSSEDSQSDANGSIFFGTFTSLDYSTSFHYVPEIKCMDWHELDVSKFYGECITKSKLLPSWFLSRLPVSEVLSLNSMQLTKKSIEVALNSFKLLNSNGFDLVKYSMMTWNPISTLFLPLFGESI